MLFHHSRQLAFSPAGVVNGVRLLDVLTEPQCSGSCSYDDPWHDAFYYDPCYRYAAGEAGFWPLWLAVGETLADRRMTGYANQFRRDGLERAEEVLFSWKAAPAAVRFLDYQLWYIVLNSVSCSHNRKGHRAWLRKIEPYWERQIWRRSWSSARWIRKALADPHSVQALAPQLDLTTADEIWCASKDTKALLASRGFESRRLKVRRLSPER